MMAGRRFHLASAMALAALTLLLTLRAASGAPSKSALTLAPSKAQEFLALQHRPKRNVWDRSRPDVQQWIQQFMLMGFDEQRLETDLAYWLDQSRGMDQGRQHHYDENSPHANSPQASQRHGANVNYDYY
ncbi:hypothetical protein NHX12_007573 [Muraenolepis orangiensis]|uniref:Uncharacterized protein n=1 Tax=Muraenolepis orangiensis TaxID=630683 RepID=A0A9Q0DQ60_9TELE|nr:hypothetical protein NHX12_007573 [Muraenolepis orangiensis]